MDSANASWQAVFDGLILLRDAWPAKGWSYDRRLKCVVSSIPMTDLAAAESAIALALPRSWSAESLAGASASAKATAEVCGGLRAAQKLLWNGDELGAFGLWWPWADGVTVSLRIGLHDVDLPKERYPRLRDIFGIPQAPAPV